MGGPAEGVAKVTPAADCLEVAYGLVDPSAATREWMLVVRNAGPLPPVFRSPLEALAHRVRGVQASARDSVRCVGGARARQVRLFLDGCFALWAPPRVVSHYRPLSSERVKQLRDLRSG